MHLVIAAARWLGLLILGALVPKLLKAIFTSLPLVDDDPRREQQEHQASAISPGTHGFEVNQIIDTRFQLVRLLEQGKLSEMWEGQDLLDGKKVIVRFLLSKYLSDASMTKRFAAAAHATSRLWRGGIPPVIHVGKDLRLPYYVCEYLEGERLTTYACSHRDSRDKTAALREIERLAEVLEKAHGYGIVHGSITPDDILVNDGHWTLVDLELAHRFPDGCGATSLFPSLSFSAPECFESEKVAPPSDIYNLARLLQFVYCEGELPTPFSMTSKQVLDRINCSLELKQVMKRATSIEPRARYQTTQAFRDALDKAQKPEEAQVAVVGVYLQERDKIGRVLLHSVLGVSAVMLPTRALLTFIATLKHSQFGLVQLSDRPIVGAFHGLIGSVVWGCVIPLSFLLLWPLHVRRTVFGPMLALLLGGLAGFAGGALCSYLSVQVTSLVILKNLGWLLPNASDAQRLQQTMHVTRMFWAFPLEGMLTGVGIGLYLSLKMGRLAGASTQGLDPLPSKSHREEAYAIHAALEFVARGPWLQLILLCPVAFSWFAASALKAHGVDVRSEWHRTLGEGFVQAVGATGLVIGFFYGIVAPSQAKTMQGIWRTPLSMMQKWSHITKDAAA